MTGEWNETNSFEMSGTGQEYYDFSVCVDSTERSKYNDRFMIEIVNHSKVNVILDSAGLVTSDYSAY